MVYIIIIILGLLIYLLLTIFILIMSKNYVPENSDEYLTVYDYDYNTIVIGDPPLESEVIAPEVNTMIDISGLEEDHIPVLFCCTIDRYDTLEYHKLYTPIYGYLRENIHIEDISLSCVDGKLHTIANIRYIEDGKEIYETVCNYENGWYKCEKLVPDSSTRGQIQVHSDGRVGARIVWGAKDEIKEIVNYKFSPHIPVHNRRVVWSIHVQEDKTYLVIASTSTVDVV